MICRLKLYCTYSTHHYILSGLLILLYDDMQVGIVLYIHILHTIVIPRVLIILLYLVLWYAVWNCTVDIIYTHYCHIVLIILLYYDMQVGIVLYICTYLTHHCTECINNITVLWYAGWNYYPVHILLQPYINNMYYSMMNILTPHLIHNFKII